MREKINLVILGGGKGSRLKLILKKKSKILAKVNNQALLSNLVNNFSAIKNKYLIINKNQKDIKQFVNKNNVKIEILEETRPLGDGGCLFNLKTINKFYKNYFLIVPGDLYLKFDFKKFIKFHFKKKSLLTLCVHPSDHVHDSDTVKYDTNEKLIKFFKKPHKDLHKVGHMSLSGIYLIHGSLLRQISSKELKSNQLIQNISKNTDRVFCYNTENFIKDAGTKDRLTFLRKSFKKKRIHNFECNKPKIAIFLDRDGVINKEFKGEKFGNPINLFKTTINAISIFNKLNLITVVITNQPAIAKGFITEKYLKTKHEKLLNFLSSSGCYLNKIYFCPHHPEKGFVGENKLLKIRCGCRKPKIGLILKAKKEFNINLTKSFLVGNSISDYRAAKKAGVRYFNIQPFGKKKEFLNYNIKNYKNLLVVANIIKNKLIKNGQK